MNTDQPRPAVTARPAILPHGTVDAREVAHLSGLEFLEAVRHVAPEIPVVMLTTAGQTTVIREAKALGAKAWRIKPFKVESILEAAHRLTTTPTSSAPSVTD